MHWVRPSADTAAPTSYREQPGTVPSLDSGGADSTSGHLSLPHLQNDDKDQYRELSLILHAFRQATP